MNQMSRLTAFKCGGWDGIKNLALFDSSSILTMFAHIGEKSTEDFSRTPHTVSRQICGRHPASAGIYG